MTGDRRKAVLTAKPQMAQADADREQLALYEQFSRAFASVGVDGVPWSEFERDLSHSVEASLRLLLNNDQFDEKSFYQLFCPVWQLFDSVFRPFLTQSDYVSYVCNRIIVPLCAAKPVRTPQRQKVCAMCISFVLNSLDHSPATQTYALRMLLMFATQTSLCSHQPFIDWVLGFMQNHISDMIRVKENLALFIEVCVDFFSAIPPELYDSNTVKAVFKFFGAKVFQKQLSKKDGPEKEKLMKIATMTLNASLLLDDEFFFFEIIKESELLWDNLNAQQREILDVFVSGDLEAFEKLIQKNDYLQKSGISVDVARFKMQVLTLVSLCEGKKSVAIKDIADKLGISVLELKKLVVKINKTDVAKLKVDGVANTIVVEFCQPRLFKPEDWKAMEDRLQSLIESLGKSLTQ